MRFPKSSTHIVISERVQDVVVLVKLRDVFYKYFVFDSCQSRASLSVTTAALLFPSTTEKLSLIHI